jgi:hypothetical protein
MKGVEYNSQEKNFVGRAAIHPGIWSSTFVTSPGISGLLVTFTLSHGLHLVIGH